MTTAIAEPIDLPDVRSYLSMVPDDTSEDPLLTDAIAFCRDRLESVLPYYLAEREVTVSKELCTWGLLPDVSIPLKGPVLEVERVRITFRDGSDATAPAESWYVFGGKLHLALREALDLMEAEVAPIGVTVEYRAGSHCPPVVKNALLMMVRNRYERRDEDPLTDAVMSSIYPETRPNI